MQVEILSRIAEVPAADWDALAPPDDPFSEHAFLAALEASGSVSAESGWTPCHLLVREGGRVVAAMPLYVKDNSYGEYIFDWGWAEAAHRAGIHWYPKLVSAVPFTPVTGGRLLIGGPPEPDDPRVSALLAGVQAIARQLRASSVHVLFCSRLEQQALAAAGAIPRLTYQFHWENHGYQDFEHWLSTFRSKERKKARAERRLPPGVVVREATGDQLSEAEARVLYELYLDTVSRKGGWDYLRPAFFEALRRPPLAGRVRCFLAEEDGTIVSASLCFQKGGGLYGRSWGCRPGYHGLHFELCYHAPIARCIAEGWSRFEAGAQGVHKLKRGLMPSPTYSAHWVAHPGLSKAIEVAVRREAVATEQHMRALADHGPFRRDEPRGPVPEGPAEAGDGAIDAIGAREEV